MSVSEKISMTYFESVRAFGRVVAHRKREIHTDVYGVSQALAINSMSFSRMVPSDLPPRYG
jgi:hypothetical protein